METRDFLGYMAALFFLLVILAYMVWQGWMPGIIFQFVQPLVGLIALILVAIYVVEKIRENL